MVAQILFGKVMHARLFPKRNRFTYGIYYLSLPLSQMGELPLPHNRFAPVSFYDCDHGSRKKGQLLNWARQILSDHGLAEITNGDIILTCMPRIFGYVFNPVSFWHCYDAKGELRCVLCEVHNTFKEQHTYICVHPDHRPITPEDILTGEKLFHVSPFLQREGYYQFRFNAKPTHFQACVDFYDASGKKQLITSLAGKYQPMTKNNLQKAFWRYPLVTFKAIALIHWQAVKLVSKGIKYIAKPRQKDLRISSTKKS